ncbi:glycosyltransferase, partial [bacterium]|nr:glycosyltransferase [bacterium]
MIRIGLGEYKYHATSLAMFLQVMDQECIEVTLFTSPALFKEMELFFGKKRVPVKEVFLKKKESDIDFLKFIKRLSTRLDKLIFLELQFKCDEEWDCYLDNNWGCPIWYVIHDTIKETGSQFIFPWRVNKYRENKYYKDSLNIAERVIVHGSQMKAEVENMLISKPISFLPFSFADTLLKREIPDELPGKVRFCVTGNITDQRRDYFSLLGAFNKALDSTDKLELILAGRPVGKYGEKVVEACQTLNKKRKNNKIAWFDEYVPEDLYMAILKEADFLIAPLTKPSSFWVKMFKKGGYNCEYNIRTKQTGATFDS